MLCPHNNPICCQSVKAPWLEPGGELWSSAANPGPWQLCKRSCSVSERDLSLCMLVGKPGHVTGERPDSGNDTIGAGGSWWCFTHRTIHLHPRSLTQKNGLSGSVVRCWITAADASMSGNSDAASQEWLNRKLLVIYFVWWASNCYMWTVEVQRKRANVSDTCIW